NGDVSLTRKFRRAGLSFNYGRGVSPGNGLYLTSRYESASVGFSYTGIRRVNFGADAGYGAFGSLTQNLGKYYGFNGGTGLSYHLTKAVHFIARYDYRHYEVNQSSFKRGSYRASLGFGFSPGDIPLALW